MSEDIEILAVKRIDDDRRVAHVRVSNITIRSLWIVGLASGKPRISWPETGKGYPIVEASPELKARVDRLVFEALRLGDRRRPHKRRARRRASSARPTAVAEPDFDDPLDDLFGGAAT